MPDSTAPASGMTAADYPAAWGQPVTERHARTCREQGHTTWITDGQDTETCPRCGEVTTRPCTATTPSRDGRLYCSCGSISNPAGYCCETGARIAQRGGTVALPAHLMDGACYVCGEAEHGDSTERGGHRYWSNAQALLPRAPGR